MAQPAPEHQDAAEAGFRVASRSYSGETEPLVEVLLLLYDWSIERELRTRSLVPMPPETGTEGL